MATYRTILTNKGLALIAAAGSSGVPIVLTDMAVGDGNGNPTTPDPAQTSLARERYRHAVNQLTVNPNDPTQFTGELIVPADIGGFTMREVGLYTIDGDLFAVANVPNAYKPTDAEGSFGDTVIRMVFKVSNASVVTIVIDPNVTVATHTWVLNNVNAATMIPGGVTDQILAKRSNADGDVEWRDPAAGFTVIVFSREETQTLAASQTVVDLAVITAEGSAVYVEGVRLRAGEFSQTGPAQITLAQSYPAGAQITAVQNEEVGTTDMLLRPNNLSDVPDKAAARQNLGLVNWLAGMDIRWSQLTGAPNTATRWPVWGEVGGKPDTYPPSAHDQAWDTITGAPNTATRWPSWNEVTSKPSTFTPAAHTHAWDAITGAPNTATRWPSWNEVTSKPSTFTPAAHTHPEYAKLAGDTFDGGVVFRSYAAFGDSSQGMARGYTAGGVHYLALRAQASQWGSPYRELTIGTDGTMAWQGTFNPSGGYDYGSSLKLKDIEGAMVYGLREVRAVSTLVGRYKAEYCNDGRRRVFFDAEQLAGIMPELVDRQAIEFNGEKVASIKLDQVMPPAYRAIAELADMVDALRAEVAALKAAR